MQNGRNSFARITLWYLVEKLQLISTLQVCYLWLLTIKVFIQVVLEAFSLLVASLPCMYYFLIISSMKKLGDTEYSLVVQLITVLHVFILL